MLIPVLNLALRFSVLQILILNEFLVDFSDPTEPEV